MTALQAKIVERGIIALCVISILFIFQPFSITLFGIGCVTVVIGALAFNLIPFCREGVPARTLGRVVMIAAASTGCPSSSRYRSQTPAKANSPRSARRM